MKLTVNGQLREVTDGTSLEALMILFGLADERVAIECNGVIVNRDSFSQHVLRDGDTVEIVRFVGGG